MQSRQIRRLASLIRGIESAMLTTVSTDGSITSRPMVVQDFDFDGNLWFFTSRSSAKVQSIESDGHVGISFVDTSGNRYISMSGVAEVIEDSFTMQKVWTKAFERWFPEGPSSKDLALIRVRVTAAEAWDAPHSEMTESFSLESPPYKKITERAQVVRPHHH